MTSIGGPPFSEQKQKRRGWGAAEGRWREGLKREEGGEIAVRM